MVGVGRSCRGSGWHRAACVSPAVISLLGVLLLLHTQYQEVTTLFGTLSDGAKRHPPLARAWLADDVAIALAPAGGLHCVAKTKGLVQCTGTFEATIEGDAVQLAGGRVHLEDHPDVKSSRERASNAGALLGPSEDFRVVPWRPETPKTKRSSGLTKQGNATSTNSDIVMFGLRLKQKMAGNVLMTSSLSGPNHFADATLLNRGAAKTEVNTSKVQEKASTWRNNPEDRLHQRQVVVVAGVEGTGHHMFHDMFWPSLAKFVSGVAHDRGFHLHFTGRDQPQFEGLAGLQHHFAYRNRPTFAGYTPAYKAMVNAERLINLSISLPNVSLLLTDEPSFPALPLELSTNGGFETMPFHCPDLLALAAGAAAANWTLRVVVLVRNWPDVLHSGVTREVYGMRPVPLETYAARLQMSMMELNAQVSSLTVPWALLDYDAMVSAPLTCAPALARFLGLPAKHALKAVGGVRRPRSNGNAKWSSNVLKWIEATFTGNEALVRWPMIEQAWKHKTLC